MKTIGSLIILLTMLVCYDGNSQAKQEQKKKETGSTDNTKAQGTSDYRNNRVSGNPNNITTEEGSNRRTSSGRETDESSGSVQSDSAATVQEGTTSSGQGVKADPDVSNVPAVVQESTSQSGSPAMLSGKKGSDRDGTNNVQRAKPNMAGADVRGLKYGEGKDPDREIRESGDVHGQGTGNNVSGQRNKGQQGARQRATRTKNPHPRNMGTLPDQKLKDRTDQDTDIPDAQSENNNISGQENNDQMMNNNSGQKQKDKKKKKRWFKRD